jgi:preprotein translocase SecE subunit
VANVNPSGRRPRVRKSAPTVRERQEAAAIQGDIKKPRRISAAAKSAARPLKKLRLSERRPVKVISRVLRPLKRILNWLIPRYFINSWREVRRVIWPSRRETWRLTLAVFVFAIIFGALVAGVDKGLDEIFKKVVLK